jgi:hypothetical protein
MPKSRHETPVAHLYAPRFPHDALEVIANRKGLERLINTLIEAVDQGRSEGHLRSADGYDAPIRVTRIEGRRRAEDWRRAGSPFWDIDDPFVARVVSLTEENDRLRQVIATLRRERKSLLSVDEPHADDPAGEMLEP